MKCLVFNGWAAGAEAWRLCTFEHDWLFDYVEQLNGLPEKVMAETDAAILVGFSMGGSTALRMTAHRVSSSRPCAWSSAGTSSAFRRERRT